MEQGALEKPQQVQARSSGRTSAGPGPGQFSWSTWWSEIMKNHTIFFGKNSESHEISSKIVKSHTQS